jgi:hypothetical protein
MKILLICGHLNVKYNSIVSLHGNTGTTGELEINKRITDRVASMLRDRKFEVVQSDANANDDKSITSQDFNLALALHCDMDVANDQGGGMVGSGDKSVDNSWQESLRIKKVFDSIYFKETQIVNKNIVTQGMSKYYMWQYLSFKTPCVLIEMGQAKDPHDSVLLGNTDLIASAITRSICSAFNVSYEINIPTPPTIDPKDKQISDLKTEINDLKDTQNRANIKFGQDLALKDLECQEKIKTYKTKIINFINSL